jgi:hypothetical protein
VGALGGVLVTQRHGMEFFLNTGNFDRIPDGLKGAADGMLYIDNHVAGQNLAVAEGPIDGIYRTPGNLKRGKTSAPLVDGFCYKNILQRSVDQVGIGMPRPGRIKPRIGYQILPVHGFAHRPKRRTTVNIKTTEV